jgi:uncharacterized membrane protein YdbT with pleckstrin-like domain
MGYIEKNLIAGENILYKTRLHSVAVLFPMMSAAVIAVAGVFCFYQSIADRQTGGDESRIFAGAGLVLLVVAAMTVGIATIKRNATEMAVTNRRILVKSGIMSRRTIELLLSRVESIAITEPFFGRVFGYGTVIVRGTGGTPESFTQIAKPNEFRRYVQEQIEAGQPPRASASSTGNFS